MNKKTVWYFGLEPLKARYTFQLSEQWIPASFEKYDVDFQHVRGDRPESEQIKVGSVLDATGRGIYALTQCAKFLTLIQEGKVKNGDAVYVQDFWHPGLEGIFYALDLYGIYVEFYSMLHAQSVDEYDFTHSMRDWMRPFELGIDKRMTAIFVGSTIHKEQLRQAGFEAPIHVVSLPIHKKLTQEVLEYDAPGVNSRKKNVVFCSRFDKEKNPFFMMEVAKEFLEKYEDWTWTITTSGASLVSSVPGVVPAFRQLAKEESRFIIREGITKAEYYEELATSWILFNSSLQDYVSWTSLEGSTFGINLVFPNFRSFPDFLSTDDMYQPFRVDSALNLLSDVANRHTQARYFNTKYSWLADISDLGRQFEAWAITNSFTREVNIWHESEYIKSLINN